MMTSPTTTTGINVERDTALFMASPTFAGDYLSIPENQQPQQPLPPQQQQQEQLLTKSEEEESDDERVVSDSSMIWKDFIAGNFAGIAGIIAGHPVCIFVCHPSLSIGLVMCEICMCVC